MSRGGVVSKGGVMSKGGHPSSYARHTLALAICLSLSSLLAPRLSREVVEVCIARHAVALHYIALHCITLHCITFRLRSSTLT